MRRRVAAAVLLALVPFAILVCGLLPNMFSGFTRGKNKLQTFAQKEFGRGKSELPSAWLVTVNVPLPGPVVLKLWPDTLLFYNLLAVLLLGAVLCNEVDMLGRLAARRVGKRTLGELGALAALATYYGLFVIYWVHDHSWAGGNPAEATNLEIAARTCGVAATATLGLLLLPAAKSSVALTAAGVSWEASIVVHIALGVIFCLLAAAHVLLYFVRFCQLGSPADVLPFNLSGAVYAINGGYPTTNWTISPMASVFWPGVIAFGVLPWWRRTQWELFKYSHHWFLVLVPMVFIHAQSGWYFLLPGTLIWVLDRAARVLHVAEPACVATATAHTVDAWLDGTGEYRPEKIVELEVHWPGRTAEHSPGLYCFLNAPQISAGEWHPFSLSASPLDAAASFHIKAMGPGTFTERLHDFVARHPRDLVLHVDGPYGPEWAPSAPRVLLIAGGIGVTPMLNAMRFILQGGCAGVEHVHLVWASRSPEIFAIFADRLHVEGRAGSSIAAGDVSGGHDATVIPTQELSLYCSARSQHVTCSALAGDLPVLAGTPDLSAVLSSHCRAGRTAARVCGPPGLVRGTQKAVDALPAELRAGLDFDTWSFVL